MDKRCFIRFSLSACYTINITRSDFKHTFTIDFKSILEFKRNLITVETFNFAKVRTLQFPL